MLGSIALIGEIGNTTNVVYYALVSSIKDHTIIPTTISDVVLASY